MPPVVRHADRGFSIDLKGEDVASLLGMVKTSEPVLDEDTKNALVNEGKKIALLLGALNLTEEAKLALTDLLSQMSLWQLRQFSAVLENNLFNQSTAETSRSFERNLREIKKEEEAAQAETDVEALNKIKDLEKELR